MLRVVLLVFTVLAGSVAHGTDTTVVVLDASGSMDETIPIKSGGRIEKMKAAQVALLEASKDLPASHNLGMIVFSAKNLEPEQEWVYPIGPVDKEKLASAIQSPIPGGGTPLGEYMKKGADALLVERNKNDGRGTYNLIIVTDGVANDGHLVEKNLPLIMARGIRVSVVALAMEEDVFLSKKVNSYRNASDMDSLRVAVKEAIDEVIVEAIAEVPVEDEQFASSWFDEIAPLPEETASAAMVALNSLMLKSQPISNETLVAAQNDTPQSQGQNVEQSTNENNGSSRNDELFLFIISLVVLAIPVVVAIITAYFDRHR